MKEAIDHGWGLRTKWNYIGLQLGINAATLDSIKQTNHGVPGDCFMAVIQHWLQNASDPTWEQLDIALKAKTVHGKHF